MMLRGYLITFIFILWIVLVTAGKDYYSILDVPRDAPKSQIKRHFKKLSRVYHPDKNSGDEQASQKFMEIANAYEVLMNDEKRAIYDRYGEEGLKQSGGHGGGGGGVFHDPFDIFSHFFGGGGGHRHHQQEKRGPDVTVPLQVTLEDIYRGVEIEIDISKQVLCEYCHGSGARQPEDIHTCNVCEGRGMIVKRAQVGPGMFQQFQQVCHQCGGKGKIIQHVCTHCGGKKVKRGNENYSIHIERGMSDGEAIILEEEGDEYPDTISGNIIFELKTVPHERFERRGHHLYTKQYITLIEALTGFKKTLKHLDDSEIELSREGITQYGYVQTIQGEGMPDKQDPSKHGDLFVEYQVVFPTEISKETIDYLKKGSTFKEERTKEEPHLIHQEL